MQSKVKVFLLVPLFFFPVCYFPISPLNLPSARTGEVLGSPSWRCSGASPMPAELLLQDTAPAALTNGTAQVQPGPATGAVLALSYWALSLAQVFDGVFLNHSKTGLLCLLYLVSLTLFSCGLLPRFPGPICFLKLESRYLSSKSFSRQVISLRYTSRSSKERLVSGTACLGYPVYSEEWSSRGLLQSCRGKWLSRESGMWWAVSGK